MQVCVFIYNYLRNLQWLLNVVLCVTIYLLFFMATLTTRNKVFGKGEKKKLAWHDTKRYSVVVS